MEQSPTADVLAGRLFPKAQLESLLPVKEIQRDYIKRSVLSVPWQEDLSHYSTSTW